MTSCKESARLLSKSMEQSLSLWERMGLWFHLSMCRLCRGYSKDLQLLREAARGHAQAVETETAFSDATLSTDARERIKRLLEGGSS